MNGNVIRVPARSLKEQFARSSEAWKEQSDPIFRFWAEGDWWGFPFFSLSASRYFGEKQTLCLYWPLATVVIAGPKVLDFYAVFCALCRLHHSCRSRPVHCRLYYSSRCALYGDGICVESPHQRRCGLYAGASVGE